MHTQPLFLLFHRRSPAASQAPVSRVSLQGRPMPGDPSPSSKAITAFPIQTCYLNNSIHRHALTLSSVPLGDFFFSKMHWVFTLSEAKLKIPGDKVLPVCLGLHNEMCGPAVSGKKGGRPMSTVQLDLSLLTSVNSRSANLKHSPTGCPH